MKPTNRWRLAATGILVAVLTAGASLRADRERSDAPARSVCEAFEGVLLPILGGPFAGGPSYSCTGTLLGNNDLAYGPGRHVCENVYGGTFVDVRPKGYACEISQ